MKKGKFLGILLALMLACTALYACSGNGKKVQVSFYDGDTLIKAVTVTSGEKIADTALDVDGKTFKGWYSVPTFQFRFDFTQPIEEDTKVYGKYRPSAGVADTRVWQLMGTSAKGGVLKASNWGDGKKDIPELMLKSVENAKNEFEVTLDLYAGDEFQVLHSSAWEGQHGFGYMREVDRKNFEGRDNVYNPSDLFTGNIKVIKDGNYKINLYTNMENSDGLDEITATRLGNAVVEKVYTTKPVLLGTPTGGGLLDAYGDLELKLNATTKLYETTAWMNANDYFVVAIDPSWSYQLRTSAVVSKEGTAASEAQLAEDIDLSYGEGIKAKKTGNYKIELKPAYNKITELPDMSKCEVYVKYVDAAYSAIAGATDVTFKVAGQPDLVAHVRNNARLPLFKPTAENKAFIGWFESDTKAIGFESKVPTTAGGITLTAKFVDAATFDIREMFLCGYGGSWDPQTADVMNTDNPDTATDESTTVKFKKNQLTHTDNSNIYTLDITVKEGDSFYVAACFGTENAKPYKMGLAYKADVVTTGADLLKTTSGNLVIKTQGTYTLTLNTLENTISLAAKA